MLVISVWQESFTAALSLFGKVLKCWLCLNAFSNASASPVTPAALMSHWWCPFRKILSGLRFVSQCRLLSRKSEHLVLPRPFSGRVDKAGHSHSAR